MQSNHSSLSRPKIAISGCLAGDRVRFNAGNVRAPWIMDVLAKHVDLVPLCPEIAMGLSVPREAMRLSRPKGSNLPEPPRLVTSLSGKDMTEVANATADRLIAALPEDLDGYILMGRSPMCGAERVKIYDRNNVPQADGVGLFAAKLIQARPEVVVCEAGRLADPPQRERFVLRIFAQAALKRVEPKVAALQDFHRRYKFLISGQGKHHLRILGALAGAARRETIGDTLSAYRSRFFLAFAGESTRPRMADSLTHLYGFLKDNMEGRQKQLIRDAIEAYRVGDQPLLVPMTMLRFANEAVLSQYVASQAIFAPYPEMGLRHGS